MDDEPVGPRGNDVDALLVFGVTRIVYKHTRTATASDAYTVAIGYGGE